MTELTVAESGPDRLMDALQRSALAILGPDRHTRGHTSIILLCAVMYAICCAAAAHAATVGMMLPFGPQILTIVTFPAHLIFYVLVRSGVTRHWRDPGLMVLQNLYALLAISFAYITLDPSERGMVLVLIALVIVFGMYTHAPRLSVMNGVLAMVLLGAAMGVLSSVDPTYYPPQLELLRFGVMLGSLPVLIFTAYLISSWRQRLSTQRRELQQALDQVQQLATRDALTGLYNRRHMQEKLAYAAQRFQRYGERFTVALIDLDHFKRINDEHGHVVGDQALMAFASAASMVLRDTDTLARWGGEEFLFLMPNTSPQKATIALDRVRDALASVTVSQVAPQLRLRFSAGLALCLGQEGTDATLERADQALYQAKSAGRHRSVVAAGPEQDI
ncbi:MAG: GGDEF domain-containing protein [Aquabacterium sp.]|jgi:diguanylate cyclase (GGDEF)-like protein|nr:GGDEF domain-containing protein [Aquabacterium sp.]